MTIKRFLTILRYMFLPQRRNACPHCGGIRCIGACQFSAQESDAVTGQESTKQEAPAPSEGKQG